jgi:hypothetical protein
MYTITEYKQIVLANAIKDKLELQSKGLSTQGVEEFISSLSIVATAAKPKLVSTSKFKLGLTLMRCAGTVNQIADAICAKYKQQGIKHTRAGIKTSLYLEVNALPYDVVADSKLRGQNNSTMYGLIEWYDGSTIKQHFKPIR